jgi:hypothetical protein
MIALALGLFFVNLFSASALAENRTGSVKLQDLTPADSPLKFQVQKIGWKYDKVRIWGLITNTGSTKFRFVSVSFTALGKNGEFLVREKAYGDPSDVSGNNTGVIDDFPLDTEGQMPAVIQYRITGDKE